MSEDKSKLSQAALEFLAVRQVERSLRAAKIESQQILKDMVKSEKIKLTLYRKKRRHKRTSKI